MSAPLSPPTDPTKPMVSEVRVEEEGNKVESQAKPRVDGGWWKVDQIGSWKLHYQIDDENIVKWYNCNLYSSIFGKMSSVRKHITAKHTVKSKPEKPEQKNLKNIIDEDEDDNAKKCKRWMRKMGFKLRAWACSPAHRWKSKFYQSLQFKPWWEIENKDKIIFQMRPCLISLTSKRLPLLKRLKRINWKTSIVF